MSVIGATESTVDYVRKDQPAQCCGTIWSRCVVSLIAAIVKKEPSMRLRLLRRDDYEMVIKMYEVKEGLVGHTTSEATRLCLEKRRTSGGFDRRL